MLSDLIHRPIGVLMTLTALLIVSMVYVREIPIGLLPDTPIPQISVHVDAPTKDARTLENTVTKLLRNQLLQVNALADISSQTYNGSAIIHLDLDYDTNTDLAALEISEKIDQVLYLLPRDVERPRVIQSNVSDIPVMYLQAYTSAEEVSHVAFSSYIRRTIKRRLEQIPEIAFVDIHGTATPEIKVTPKTAVLMSMDMDPKWITDAIQNSDLQLGNIWIKDGQYEYGVQLQNKILSAEDIRNIPIRNKKQVYMLSDVADIRTSEQERTGVFYLNGQQAVSMTLRPKASANSFELKKKVEALLSDLREHQPELHIQVVNDQSKILSTSIQSLRSSLLYGMAFACIIVFLFFNSWRLPLLIVLSVPISLLLTLFGFYLFDITINIISLTGLILGVGLMIDNAIIIVENIQQKATVLPLKAAAVLAAQEVVKPLISSALTTSSVFLPLILLSGIAGLLFYDQAISIALALGCSILVSYFILPVLSSIILSDKQRVTQNATDNWHDQLINFIIKSRYVFLPLFFILGACSIYLFQLIPRSSFPDITRDHYNIHIDWNEEINVLTNTERYKKLYSLLKDETTSASAYIGESQFYLERKKHHINETDIHIGITQKEDISAIDTIVQQFLADYPSATYDITVLKNVFDFVFKKEDYPLTAHVQESTSEFVPSIPISKKLSEDFLTINADVATPPLQNILLLNIDKERSAQYQVSPSTINNKLQELFGQKEIVSIDQNDQKIPVRLKDNMSHLTIASILENTFVRSNTDHLISLQNFVTYTVQQEYKSIEAINTGESLDFQFGSADHQTISDVKTAVSKYPNLLVQFSGEHFAAQKMQQELEKIVLLVFLLLFLILASQFESLLQPVIIFLTLPVGLLGGLLGLYLLGQTINVIALIGLVIMSGIDVNDAILKIDIYNRNRANGMSLLDAIKDGSHRRLKPIVMTSLTTILAMLPILWGRGLGVELQRPLAIALIGGLIFGTIASIVMIPMLYYLKESVLPMKIAAQSSEIL